jgi:hypothetical protein
MMAWAIMPIIGAYQSSILFQIPFLGIMATWIVTGLLNMTKSSEIKCLSRMIPFMVVMYLYVFIGFGNLNIPTSFDYVLLFAFLVNGVYYIECPDSRFNKRIMWFALILLVITSITTIAVLLVDENASRALTSSSSEDGLKLFYKKLNVGSFRFVYGLVIIIPMIIYYLRAKSNLFEKVILLLITALFVYVVLLSNFTTALILLFLDFCIILITCLNLKSKVSFFYLTFIVILFIPFFLSFFLDFMIGMTDSIYSQGKLTGIMDVIHGEGSYDDTTSRGQLFITSLKSFLGSPIWGVGALYSQADYQIVGQHAQFVDDLARYGLIGFIPLMSFVLFGLKKIYFAFNERFFFNRKVLGPILIYVALGFLDPIYNEGMLASIFIVVPVINCLIYEKKDNTIHNRLSA